jgi:hypothetical protein
MCITVACPTQALRMISSDRVYKAAAVLLFMYYAHKLVQNLALFHRGFESCAMGGLWIEFAHFV